MPDGQSVRLVLNFGSMRFKCMCSYCLCPVEKTAVMNRKLLGKATGACNENANYSGFILPNKFWLKFRFFSKSWINDAKCKKKQNWKLRENVLQRKQKFEQLHWSERYFFMEHIYHKEFGDAKLGQSRCLPGENYCFFSLRYYSWEVGKERRKLRVEGSIRCFAQSLRRPLLPFESFRWSHLKWHISL